MIEQTEQESNSSISLQGWLFRFRKHRLLLMLAVLIGWLLVTAVAMVMPAKYRSETVILIEQQRVPEHYVEPNVAVDLQQRLQSMSEQILSRTRLLGIIEKFHLYGGQRSGDSDKLLDVMRKDISVDLVRGDRPDQVSAFKVAYSSSTPIVAQQVTAELTSLFIEENLRNREQLSEDTTSFIEDEMTAARKNLDQQERRLREFKERYMGQLPEQTTSNLQILSGLQSRLQSATDALDHAQQQRLSLQFMLNQYRAMQPQTAAGPATDPASLPAVYVLNQKLESLHSQLAELRTKYTDRHPDIVRLTEEIAATEKLRAQTVNDLQSTNTSPEGSKELAQSPFDTQTRSALVQVESQLKSNELEITSSKSTIEKLEIEIRDYQKRLNVAPALEQELAAITRDHDQSRENYDSLLAKHNQSVMATNLEKRQQGEQFRMIDPPSLPQKPYFPNRLYFSLAGIAFGLALGVGSVILVEMLNPRVYTEEELRGVVETQLFVSIPPLPTLAENRRHAFYRAVEWGTATMMAIVIPAVTFWIYRKG